MAYVKRNRLWERSGFLHIWQQLQVKVTCIKVLSHIGRILSRVGYVAFTFCPENQTDGSYRYYNRSRVVRRFLLGYFKPI